MVVIEFIKTYWVIITFFFTTIITCLKMYHNYKDATKCSLRNDILQIYDTCKDKEEITHYQLQAILYSSEIYFKMGGNSFVEEVISKVKKFKVID